MKNKNNLRIVIIIEKPIANIKIRDVDVFELVFCLFSTFFIEISKCLLAINQNFRVK